MEWNFFLCNMKEGMRRRSELIDSPKLIPSTTLIRWRSVIIEIFEEKELPEQHLSDFFQISNMISNSSSISPSPSMAPPPPPKMSTVSFLLLGSQSSWTYYSDFPLKYTIASGREKSGMDVCIFIETAMDYGNELKDRRDGIFGFHTCLCSSVDKRMER
ncbi:hypothetical protein NE237_033212 [Protea cynaroides]|uniref:Uncharacterized protein n=1 Tax=Protea cynaroides TaxID=273540 RepID=A0A9Q0R3U4_9MAGN|nr:hypothetical protein NE237_033212 [Protea cynaroides]